MRLISIPFVVAGLTPLSSTSWAQPTSDRVARFDVVVQEVVNRDQIPGVATAVVLGERIDYEGAYGSANLETSQPMTPETLFRVSGLSKLTTAATLAALAVEGKIQLDAPIGEQWKGAPAFLSRITLRQLVRHRGGLRDEHVNFSISNREELRQYILRWDEKYVIAEPGRFRSHSSAGANLAAAVAEQVTGTDFADLLEGRLLQPLGLRLTTLHLLEAMTHPFTQGYGLRSGRAELLRPFARNWIGWPSSSVFSSAREGAVFLGALVNGGRWERRQVLSESMVRETLALTEAESDRSFRGGHSWWDGTCEFVMVPERHFAALHLQNASSGSTARKVIAAARQEWLGEVPPPAVDVQPRELAPDEAQRLAGVYWNEHALRLAVRDGRLHYRDEGAWYLKATEWFPVQRVGENRYVSRAAGSDANVVEFAAIADISGEVTYLRVGSRVFQRQAPRAALN